VKLTMIFNVYLFSLYTRYKKPSQIFCDVGRGLTTRQITLASRHHSVAGSQSPSTMESRDNRPRRMQEVNSLYTDNPALWAEYCIVGIPHNTAIWVLNFSVSWYRTSGPSIHNLR